MHYPLDLETVGRHVVTQITDGGEHPPSVSELAASYRPPNPPDLTRVIAYEEGVENDEQAKVWMVRQALARLDRYIEVTDDVPRFKDGHSLDTVRWGRRKIEPRREVERQPWEGSFDPDKASGVWAGNIRDVRDAGDLEELRGSMQTFGWVPEFPALIDENGVVLVGHRRLVIAEELGIEPVKRVIYVGHGEEADVRRLALALTSNLGFKPLTPGTRKRIALHLYQDQEWSMDRIAEALRVSQQTISGDLADLPTHGKPARGGDGRRRGSRGNSKSPQWQALHDPIIRDWMAGRIERSEAVHRGKQIGLPPCSNGTYDARRAALEAGGGAEVDPDATAAAQDEVGAGDSGERSAEEAEESGTAAESTTGDAPADETAAPEPACEHAWVCSTCGEVWTGEVKG